jgi:hypothetical protein
MNELPEYYLPYFDNYTGPSWSDGKFQGSTAKGRNPALTRLDVHSKKHDERYATCDSLECLDAADDAYYESTRGMSFVPRVIGLMPKYGNRPLRIVYKALGLGYKGSEVGEMKDQNQRYVRSPFERVDESAGYKTSQRVDFLDGTAYGRLPSVAKPTPLTYMPQGAVIRSESPGMNSLPGIEQYAQFENATGGSFGGTPNKFHGIATPRPRGKRRKRRS